MKPIVSAAHIATQAYGSLPPGQGARVRAGQPAAGVPSQARTAGNGPAAAVTVEISQEALKAARAQPVRGASSNTRPLFSKTGRDEDVTEVFEPLVASGAASGVVSGVAADESGRGRREAPLAGTPGDRDVPADQRPGRLIDIRI